jgi:hypothetical protein
MKHLQDRARHELPHHDVLDDDERSLWTLDDLYELFPRFAAPLDHEIVLSGDDADFSLPPPPHGASWDPI